MKLSIIVAVYNTSKYLRQCLDSVLNQDMTQDDFEVIIVNDCSTDNSIEIINEVVAGYSNVTVIDKKINEATFWCRVDGIKVAKGDYIGFVDSDDWCEKNMYRVLFDKAVNNNADVVECGIIYEYPDGKSKPCDKRQEKVITTVEELKDYADGALAYHYELWSRIFSRKIIDKFVQNILPELETDREKYVGFRNEDDLLFPLLVSLGDTYMFANDNFCRHREDVADSTMSILKADPKKLVDSCVYRVKAGFDVMKYNRHNQDVYKLLQRKQIDTMFGLLGKILDFGKDKSEEAIKVLQDAVDTFGKVKDNISINDYARFMHLRLKVFWCLK